MINYSSLSTEELLKLKVEKEKEIATFNNKQMAVKIFLNSAFGAQGTPYFRYYNLNIAEGITVSGQLSIRWISDRINKFLNDALKTEDVDRVVLVDTDSVVISLEDLINRVCPEKSTAQKIAYMDRVTEEILQPVIDKSYQELAQYMNAYDQKMIMKRENLVDTMISVRKKRYLMSVWNSEGVQYKEPKLKIMGLAVIKSSTPGAVRTKLKDSLKTILYSTEEEVQHYVKNYRSEFFAYTPEQIAFPRSVNSINEYIDSSTLYKKGTPIHVRGAILFNHHLRKKGLQISYPEIQEGDKIKFLYLRTPNPIHENVITFTDRLPPELNLHKFVDYEMMFQKTFVDAVQNILDAMKWNAEKKANLCDFFM